MAAGLAHPNIVMVHDVGRDAATGKPFMALEYLEGRDLADRTIAGKALDWREALRITERLADALHAAHRQGIIHRDIKPSNIMLVPSGQPKIMDFGIAKVPTSQLTMAGQVFGTPAYMSPEQALGELLDARSDLFSLGTVVYQLLTGGKAFPGDSLPKIIAMVVRQDPPPPSLAVPSIPPDVDYVIARALAKAPGDRYPDGRTMAEDIQDVLEDRPPRHRAGWNVPSRAEGTMVASWSAPSPPTLKALPAGDGVRSRAPEGHARAGA